MSELEETLAQQIEDAGLPAPERQFRLYMKGSLQPFRVDFAWPEEKIMVEVQGGIYIRGQGHVSGKGYQRDCLKAQQIALRGCLYVPVTAEDVKTGRAIALLRELLEG